MKLHINKITMSILAGAALLFSACSDGDTVFDDIVANENRGGVLRTVEILSDEIPIGQTDSSFGVTLEVQTKDNGSRAEFVEVYLGFRDNTVDEGGTDLDKDQIRIADIDKDTWTIGEFGYPRFTYEVTLPEMLGFLGLSDTDVDGGDQFEVRFELVLSDGSRYSFDDNTGTLTGSFFRSPFLYTPTVVCPPTPPTPGDWTFVMADAYGDGWNGAALLFSIDGEVTEVFVTSSEGAGATKTVNVPEGAQVVSLKFRSGDWDSEITYTVTAATGNVITEQAEPYSTDPPADVELINYCILNF
ncbi:MAG: hypothetical protein JSW57_11445 [Flavobacteriaceae bacterium]|nr:MAG: hypothetical protein JSW57_11445 [Flavobacteriaceae bacterium]